MLIPARLSEMTFTPRRIARHLNCVSVRCRTNAASEHARERQGEAATRLRAMVFAMLASLPPRFGPMNGVTG